MPTFELRIPITEASTAALKRDIACSLPGFKSSHLSEAIARGIGFRTHASLLTAAKSGETTLHLVSSAGYLDFLSERGYNANEKTLFIAAGRVAIRNVMQDVPRLSHFGYGIGRPLMKPDGKWERATEHQARFLVERESLLSDECVEEFLRAMVFVQQIDRIKTINQRSGSYGLKHRAEKLPCCYPGGAALGPGYVGNGSLVAAAIHAGFAFETHLDHLGYEAVNVAFNMSQRSLDAMSST